MKRLLCFLFALMLLFLCGCTGSAGEDPAVFYYCRTEYSFGSDSAVIAAEERDITGHEGDLQYLLSLYLVGPLDEELESPFPSRTKVLSVLQENDTILLEITDCSNLLSDVHFSLGCACLAMTTLDLTHAAQVTIISGEETVTLNPDSLLLYDNAIPTETSPMEDPR